MMEKVLAQLLELGKVYTQLLSLAREKTDALTRDDLKALGDVTKREEEASDQAFKLENERMGVVNQLALMWGMQPENVTVSFMASQCQGELAIQLTRAAEQLLDCLQLLRRQNETNARLLEIKLRLAAFVMDAARDTGNGPGTYYNMNGAELEPNTLSAARFLDSEI
ncbi:MAG: flagellar protein FlgN [Eubacteriales bacterium]|nr:flagellar protein FlgN [Eubacteriales bacterium]